MKFLEMKFLQDDKYWIAVTQAQAEANEFVEKSMGLYSDDDIPAFMAGYLCAILKKARGNNV